MASEASELEQKIIKQIEYYFSDSNLYRDKFLQEQIGKDDGWVTLETLLTFKRLQALSEDAKVIVDAIEKSDEGLIEIHESREKIRRHPERPLPEQNEEVRKEIISRTAYVKGFPLDSTMSDLIDFFNNYEKVSNIVMRKYLDKASKEYKFKGSVFATFATKDQCEAFLALEDIKYKEAVLIRKWQNVYMEEKREERSKSHKKKNQNAEPAEEKIKLPVGATIHLTGFGDDATRELIREQLPTTDELAISFIEFNKGDAEGYVRFTKEGAAKEIFEKLTDGKITVAEKEITVRILEGEEEEKYLKEQVQQIKNRREQMSHKNKKFGKGGKRGQFNKKRKHDDDGGGDDDKPAKKKNTTED